jgi:hypothetical protein
MTLFQQAFRFFKFGSFAKKKRRKSVGGNDSYHPRSSRICLETIAKVTFPLKEYEN